MGKTYAIDLPNPHDFRSVWVTHKEYDDRDEALADAKLLWGADDEGNINIISEFEEELDGTEETVADVMFNKIYECLAKTDMQTFEIHGRTNQIMKIAFSTAGISEEKQKEIWKE